MKYLLALLISILISTVSQSQTVSTTQNWARQDLMQKTNKVIGDNLPENVEGSMYYLSSYSPGFLYYDSTKLEREFEYRYNAFSDQIEVKTPEGSDYLAQSPKLSVDIMGKYFSYVQYLNPSDESIAFGYMIKLLEDDDFILFQREYKQLKEGKKSTNGMTPDLPSKLVDKSDFYIKTDKHTYAYEFPQSKKELYKMFPEIKGGLKSFLKKEKIDLSDPNDIIKVLEYCYDE